MTAMEPQTETPALVADLVEWVARAPRPLGEVMEAWQTACPRLTVWEDAADLGLIERRSGAGGITVHVTEKGLAQLRAFGRLHDAG